MYIRVKKNTRLLYNKIVPYSIKGMQPPPFRSCPSAGRGGQSTMPSPPRAVAAASGPTKSTYGDGTPASWILGGPGPDYAAEPWTLCPGGDEGCRLGSSDRW
jgi:hypothetical protein